MTPQYSPDDFESIGNDTHNQFILMKKTSIEEPLIGILALYIQFFLKPIADNKKLAQEFVSFYNEKYKLLDRDKMPKGYEWRYASVDFDKKEHTIIRFKVILDWHMLAQNWMVRLWDAEIIKDPKITNQTPEPHPVP
jgi:hypothetical protein